MLTIHRHRDQCIILIRNGEVFGEIRTSSERASLEFEFPADVEIKREEILTPLERDALKLWRECHGTSRMFN